MKATIYLLMFVLLSVGCNSQTPKVTSKSKESKQNPDFNVALKFINDYAEFCTPKVPPTRDTTWIGRNQLLTNHFKTTYKNLLDSAAKADPELGLGFDPIFDAQNFDDKGFSIMTVDTNTGYVTVVGNTWKEFTLVLKVVCQDNKCLVDGAGVINIPKEKRAKRE